MKPIALIAFALAALALSAPAARACTCIMPEVQEAFDSAKAVFLGEVTEIIEPKTSDETAPLSDRFFIIKFKVIRAWKGAGFSSQEISVLAGQGRGCFAYPPLQKGISYLVYADPTDAKNWSVITNCNRTTAVRPGFTRSKLADPGAIDPYLDMKHLDVLPIRPRRFDSSSFRRQGAVR